MTTVCHCEERFSRRSNLQLAVWGFANHARNDADGQPSSVVGHFQRRI